MTHILPFGLCKRAPQKQLLNVYQEVEQRSVYTNWSKGHWGCGSIQIDTSWQSLCWLLQQVATLGPGKNILDSQAIVSSFRCNSGLYPSTHAVLCICVFAFIHLHPCCSKFFLLEGLTREQRRKGAPTTSLPPLLPHPPTVCNNRSPSLSSHRGVAVYLYLCIFVFEYSCICVSVFVLLYILPQCCQQKPLSLPQRSSCQPSYGSVYGSTSSHPYFSNQTPQFHAPVKDFCLTVPFLLIACNSQPR